MKAMVFAAGLGTRLKPFTDQHPKALAPVKGKTLLEHALRYLQRFGISEVVVNVHHFADQIEAVLERNNGFGSRYHISDERGEVLETGGGLLKAGSLLEGPEPIVVMNVDILTNLDLHQLLAAHQRSKGLATLAVMERSSSRQLLFDHSLNLCGWENTTTGAQRMARNAETLVPCAFSGVQVVTTEFIRGIQRQGKFSIIDAYLDAAATGGIQGFDHTGDVLLDAGRPESIAAAEALSWV